MFVNIPKPPPRSAVGDGRPLSEIAREPRFIVAVACGVAAYSMMNLVMTSAPLAMVMCNHSVTDATLGLQWHVLGMYAPSFFTGALITRFGLERITGLGLCADHRRRRNRNRRHFALAFLDRARPARRRLEFRLHRRHHHGDARATGRTSATRCRRSTISSSSARWRSARSRPASCWRASAGPRSTRWCSRSCWPRLPCCSGARCVGARAMPDTRRSGSGGIIGPMFAVAREWRPV